MTNGMEIRAKINGEEREIPDGLTISRLLEHFKLRQQTAIVEHNRKIIKKEAYSEVKVSDGDELEIVRFVGGG